MVEYGLFLTPTKIKKMCDISDNNYYHAFRFVPDSYRVQEMCNKAVGTYPSAVQVVSEWWKFQEMCDKNIFKGAFMLNHCHDRFNPK